MRNQCSDEFLELERLLEAARTYVGGSSEGIMAAFPRQMGQGFRVTAGDDGRVASTQMMSTWPQASSNRTLNAAAAPFVARSGGNSGASTVGVMFSNPSSLANAAGSFQPFHNQQQQHQLQQQYGAMASNWSQPERDYNSQQAPVSIAQVPAELVAPYTATHHIATVQNLEPRTTKKQLFDIFFPMGAVDAAILGPSAAGGSRRGVGVVMFNSADMAKIAAEKIHDFVPHGQSFPLVVTYVPATPSGGSSSDSGAKGEQPSAGAPSQIQRIGSSATVVELIDRFGSVQDVLNNADSASVTNVTLLQLLQHTISRPRVSAEDFAEVLFAICSRPQGTRTLVEDGVTSIRDRIISMGFHSPIFSPPLAGALQKFVEKINQSQATRQQEELFAFFQRCFSQSMIQLLLNPTAEKVARNVAAVACGYLFELRFLAGTPFGMARKLMEAKEADLEPTKEYLARESRSVNSSHSDADARSQSQDEANHLPWINFVEAIMSMTSSWASRNAMRQEDDNETEFNNLVKKFYGTDVPPLSAPGSSSSQDCDQVTKKTPPATPSSRPTPTSAVVSRVSPVKPSSANSQKAQGSAQPHSSSSQQQPPISPRSECGTTSLDVSVESTSSTASSSAAVGGSAQFFSTPSIWQPTQRITPRSQGSGGPTTQTSQYGSASVTFETTLQKDLLACTVYLTKLPGGLTDAKIRRLIAYFGDFNKVRMYKEKTPPAIRGSAAMLQNQQRGCFGFVEYAQPSSAKTMIDYFRNASMTSTNPFKFLVGGDLSTQFNVEEIRQLAQTRASYAKSAIHDQHVKDAVFEPAAADAPNGKGTNPPPNIKVKHCTFGLMMDGMLPFMVGAAQPSPADPNGRVAATSSAQSSVNNSSNSTSSVLFSSATHFPLPRERETHVDAMSLENALRARNSEQSLSLGLFDSTGTW